MELRPIEGFPGYLAGEDGFIYSMMPWKGVTPREPRRLQGGMDNSGYRNVTFIQNGVKFTERVHVLVCCAFYGPQPIGMEVCHGPGGRQDNTPRNLSWGNRSKNNGEDKLRDGVLLRGRCHPRNKLTEDQVRHVIYASEVESKSGRVIREEVGIPWYSVNDILAGKSWGWFTGRKRVAQTGSTNIGKH